MVPIGNSKASKRGPTKRAAQRKCITPQWKHQKKTLRLLKREKRTLDASDPGTGKTRAHIDSLKWSPGACLVIAPKSLLESAWAEDFAKFAPHLKLSVAYAENREDAFKVDADVYITNTDATKWLAKKPAKFFKKFSTLIIDEIQYFKHRTSQRSKALRKISKYFDYRRGMGATLTPNSVCDVWHPMLVIDDGKRLGTVYTHFRNAVSVPVQVGPMPNHIRWEDKKGAEAAVEGLLKGITIRHDFAEVMDVPENRQYYVPFSMNARHKKLYLELEKQAYVELSTKAVTAVNAAALRTKLLQMASGAVYSSPGDYEVVDTDRYELILDLIEARKHSVVFINWDHQRDQLIKLAKSRGVVHCAFDKTVTPKRRVELVKAYEMGFFQTIFMNYKTGAHGLTLVKGTATIWPSPIYEPDFLKQGKHRVYRGGQTDKTETILVKANGTVELQVYDRLNTKGARMNKFADLIADIKERHE